MFDSITDKIVEICLAICMILMTILCSLMLLGVIVLLFVPSQKEECEAKGGVYTHTSNTVILSKTGNVTTPKVHKVYKCIMDK